jgi:hypothetical protein
MTPDRPDWTWQTSSYSGEAGNCVEVGHAGSGPAAVRDSKNPNGPILTGINVGAMLRRIRADR